MLAFSTAEGVELVSGLSGFESALGVRGRRFRWRLFLRSSPLNVSTVYDLGVPTLSITVLQPFGLVAKHVLQEGCLGRF